MKQYFRAALTLVIISVTVFLFIRYVNDNPQVVTQLKQLPPAAIIILMVLYAAVFLAYVLVTRASLKFYDKTMRGQENIVFNAYSSLINFFGPGQSGPIFRGAYLKKRHGLGIKKFTFVTLIYLGFYGVISAAMVFAGSSPWWQTALAAGAAGAGGLVFIRLYKKRSRIELRGRLNLAALGLILGATLLQITIYILIYGFEIQKAGASASIGEIISYTGVTNLSLFVALTPGAIGIREAFLVFSQNIHNIDSSTIVAANIIDRGVHLIFLGILAVFVASVHAKDKLGLYQLKNNQK